jgi:hypothetical protein
VNNENQTKKDNPALAKTLCIILSIITLITIILGFYLRSPYIVILGIIPVAIYEAVRTEGFYTKAGSIAISILVIIEIFAIKGLFRFNLASFMGRDTMYFSGYYLPLGDIVFIFPAVAAIISLVLFFRTYGIYTKWLSILLLLSSIALIYIVNKDILYELIRTQNYYF